MFNQRGGYGGYMPPPGQGHLVYGQAPPSGSGVYAMAPPSGSGIYPGGGGGADILEFPSPYPPGTPLYPPTSGPGGGGTGQMYSGSGPPQQHMQHSGQQYTSIPHFAPQQAQQNQTAQQPTNPTPTSNPPQKPIQPSGMIRPVRRPDALTPAAGSASASSPSSPVPPQASTPTSSLSSSSSHVDTSFASAPPYSYFPSYGGPQPTGPPTPVYGQPQMAPEPYHMVVPSHYQPYNNTVHSQPPTPYHQMPPNFSDQSHQHNYLRMSAPNLAQHQHQPTQPLRYSVQDQHHHYQPLQQPTKQPQQQQQQQPPQQPAQQPHQPTAAAPATGEAEKHMSNAPVRVLPPLPGHRHSVGSKDQHHPSAIDQRRTTSEPLSELEEKLKARNKRRDSVAAIAQHGKAPESDQQSKPTDAAQQGLANLSLAEKATGKEEGQKDSKQPAAQPLSKIEQIYVAPGELSFRPENGNSKPQPTAPLSSAYKPVLLNSDSFGYVSVEAREESDSESDDDDDDDAEYEPYKEDGEVTSEYEDAGSSENLIEPEQKEDSKPAGKEKQVLRKSTSNGNRWEIEYAELDIDKQIGHGAYGSVYKGKWRNTVVAIKTIRENMASFNDDKLDEFKAEAEMMMNMRPHTNVVQLFGVCMRPYMAIVVEFLSGGSLQELLQSNEEIDLHTALRIALHTAAGVAHLHAEGICHRDLAARNLLLTSKSKDYMVVKVADFGLSRFSKEAEENFTNCKVGPLKWMPPESLQEQRYSFKSDAWSMGVVLWEIFSRREPFPGVSPVQVAINVTSRGVCLNPPSTCPREIAQLMYDCWSYEPKDRPDFRTIAHTIERVIDMNLPNYNITPMSSDEPVSGQHPGRCGLAKSFAK